MDDYRRRGLSVSACLRIQCSDHFFILSTDELSRVVATHGLKLQQYTDDCQVYATIFAEDAAATVDVFATCVTDVATWMSINRLYV